MVLVRPRQELDLHRLSLVLPAAAASFFYVLRPFGLVVEWYSTYQYSRYRDNSLQHDCTSTVPPTAEGIRISAYGLSVLEDLPHGITLPCHEAQVGVQPHKQQLDRVDWLEREETFTSTGKDGPGLMPAMRSNNHG